MDINNVDINNIVIWPYMTLPRMIGYAKFFDGNKKMSFMANDKKLLKAYNKIWKDVNSLMKKEWW